MRVEAGQLRRWINPPDDDDDAGKVFMILGEKTQWDSRITIPPGGFDPCWDFIMDGHADWHYDDVIARDSEVVDAD